MSVDVVRRMFHEGKDSSFVEELHGAGEGSHFFMSPYLSDGSVVGDEVSSKAYAYNCVKTLHELQFTSANYTDTVVTFSPKEYDEAKANREKLNKRDRERLSRIPGIVYGTTNGFTVSRDYGRLFLNDTIGAAVTLVLDTNNVAYLAAMQSYDVHLIMGENGKPRFATVDELEENPNLTVIPGKSGVRVSIDAFCSFYIRTSDDLKRIAHYALNKESYVKGVQAVEEVRSSLSNVAMSTFGTTYPIGKLND